MPDAPTTPDAMDARADELEAAAKAYLEQARRWRAVAASIRALQAETPLTSRSSYVTVAPMQSTTSVAKHPGPQASKGPAWTLARELKLTSLDALAEALKEKPVTVRAWNRRKSIPARVEAAVARLRAKLSES